MAGRTLSKIPAAAFYEEYHGHQVGHLRQLVDGLRAKDPRRRFAYLAGDSTLDNKHWLFTGSVGLSDAKAKSPALNGYQDILQPPEMMHDVSFWVNYELAQQKPPAPIVCINGAVEESCISQREVHGLLEQDKFIRDSLTEEDILIVDVGGNDVALRPTCGIIFNMALLLYLTPTCFIRMWYFIYMFRVRLRKIVDRLIATRKPKKVIICMLYFLDESPGGSWADGTLKALGYDRNPEKLQTVMRQVYSLAVSQIQIPGTEVVTLPLYEVLDGKDTKDYVARVEPSDQGGHKLAVALKDAILGVKQGQE